MKGIDLILELEKLKDHYVPLTATFEGFKAWNLMFKNRNVMLFDSTGLEYQEIYITEKKEDDEPILIVDVIKKLKEDSNMFKKIILTFGYEDGDFLSTCGGVEFKNGELFVDVDSAPHQI